jgi:hypothetical protein
MAATISAYGVFDVQFTEALSPSSKDTLALSVMEDLDCDRTAAPLGFSNERLHFLGLAETPEGSPHPFLPY